MTETEEEKEQAIKEIDRFNKDMVEETKRYVILIFKSNVLIFI